MDKIRSFLAHLGTALRWLLPLPAAAAPKPYAVARLVRAADGTEILWDRFDTQAEAIVWSRGQIAPGVIALVRCLRTGESTALVASAADAQIVRSGKALDKTAARDLRDLTVRFIQPDAIPLT